MIGERHGTPFVLTYMADPKRLVRGSREMLEQSDMAHYLLSLGLVKPRDVVEEDVAITDVSRRNCVFLATTRAGPSFVVKQAGPRSAHTLAHEAAVLGALAGAAELAGRVPVVVHHEPAERRLVVSTPGGARDWCNHRGRFPRIPARVLGRTLAVLHRLPVDHVEKLPQDVDRMWALSLPEPPHELVLDLSAAAQDLVARMQASGRLCRRLDELRNAPDDDVLVHGDLRWANCLALAAPGSQRRTRVVLVDWELAGPGAAAFDVGTVLAEYLSVWIGSIPIGDPRDPGRLVARARHPLERMRPAIHDFWSAYRVANPLGPTLRSVVELGAVRLLQTAVEHAQDLVAPTAHIVTLVQLADNMLRHPEDAALTLLGLRE
jgi:aminoglycoside phosphotransferase (APT) family kinase protein